MGAGQSAAAPDPSATTDADGPADQLDATGVQVVRDGTVVVLTPGGVALQDVPGLATLTNEWAMSAGVKLLDLME